MELRSKVPLFLSTMRKFPESRFLTFLENLLSISLTQKSCYIQHTQSLTEIYKDIKFHPFINSLSSCFILATWCSSGVIHISPLICLLHQFQRSFYSVCDKIGHLLQKCGHLEQGVQTGVPGWFTVTGC